MNIFEKYPGSTFLNQLPDDTELFPLRQRVIDLFRGLDGLEDPHFEQELDSDPYARLWEMMLATILRSAGYEPTSARHGPDFALAKDGKKVFFEAICPGPGDEGNPNSVAPLAFGAPMAQLVPTAQIVLRIRSALEEKKRKYVQYLEQGFVSENDVCVIAVNSAKIGRASGLWPPAVLQATHGLGNPYALFDRVKGFISEGIESRERIPKVSGSEVDTTFLLSEASRLISGVLYSDCSFFSLDFDLYKELMFVHNQKACVLLPLGFITRLEEIWTVSCHGCPGWRAYRIKNAY